MSDLTLKKGIITDKKDYKQNLEEHFECIPNTAKPLFNEAKSTLNIIEKALYTMPALINVVKSSVGQEVLQAVLTDDQKAKLVSGALKLMTKKSGDILATLVDPKTNKIVTQIPLKSVKLPSDIAQSIAGFSSQMQLAKLAEQIQDVQKTLDEIRSGQESDRLAIANSCQQKFLQILEIKNHRLKEQALIGLISSAEDGRNMLMLSQKSNVKFINNQPESLFGKLFSGASQDKIESRMSEIKESLCAISMMSFVEAMAYRELKEYKAADVSLAYYAAFVENTYISDTKLVERLDMMDSSLNRYWSKTIPLLCENAKKLSNTKQTNILQAGGCINGNK